MRAVIQRVGQASIDVEGTHSGEIGKGLVILVGIEDADTSEDVDWLVKKILSMRIFGDADGKMNLSVQDVKGGMLIVSQFTLHASTKKGNRPSFIKAAKPAEAIPVYERFIERMRESGLRVETGTFGAEMQVHLTNDGPVTILVDTKIRE